MCSEKEEGLEGKKWTDISSGTLAGSTVAWGGGPCAVRAMGGHPGAARVPSRPGAPTFITAPPLCQPSHFALERCHFPQSKVWVPASSCIPSHSSLNSNSRVHRKASGSHGPAPHLPAQTPNDDTTSGRIRSLGL